MVLVFDTRKGSALGQNVLTQNMSRANFFDAHRSSRPKIAEVIKKYVEVVLKCALNDQLKST